MLPCYHIYIVFRQTSIYISVLICGAGGCKTAPPPTELQSQALKQCLRKQVPFDCLKRPWRLLFFS